MTVEEIRVGVVGGGAWGTALAAHLAAHDIPIVLWAREQEVVDGINAEHRNHLFLSDVTLPDGLTATNDLSGVVGGCDLIVSAVPVQFLRATLGDLDSLTAPDTVVTVSKGIEAGALATPHRILIDLGVPEERIVALSGPSFAREVVAGRPTAVVAAGRDPARVARVQQLFSRGWFRVYASDDIIGVEIGGALKNVVALAAGVSDGLELGDNTRAAIITRGLAEITRPRCGPRRACGDVLRALGCRRPHADERGRSLAESTGRSGDRERSNARRDPRRDERGGRGRADVPFGTGTGRPGRGGTPDHRADVPVALRGQGPSRCDA